MHQGGACEPVSRGPERSEGFGGADGREIKQHDPRFPCRSFTQAAEPTELSAGSRETGEPAARIPGSRSAPRGGSRECTRAARANRSHEGRNGAKASAERPGAVRRRDHDGWGGLELLPMTKRPGSRPARGVGYVNDDAQVADSTLPERPKRFIYNGLYQLKQ